MIRPSTIATQIEQLRVKGHLRMNNDIKLSNQSVA